MVYLVGRSDTQIKTRGYRVELGEVEAAVHAVPEIQDAAVVAFDDIDGASICCAYVPRSGADLPPIALKKRLSSSLPQYMIPRRWITLSDMPRNANGKIDRPLLKEQFRKPDGSDWAQGLDPLRHRRGAPLLQ
jgi:acyl-coenzyme A synthetase/AMP-(fatty) acid ligase